MLITLFSSVAMMLVYSHRLISFIISFYSFVLLLNSLHFEITSFIKFVLRFSKRWLKSQSNCCLRAANLNSMNKLFFFLFDFFAVVWCACLSVVDFFFRYLPTFRFGSLFMFISQFFFIHIGDLMSVLNWAHDFCWNTQHCSIIVNNNNRWIVVMKKEHI